MELIEKKDWPVLFIDANICLDTEQGRRISSVIKELENRLGCSVIISLTCQDGREVIESRADLGCIVLDWDFDAGSSPAPQGLVKLIRKINTEIPVLIMTDKASISCIAVDVLDKIDGYIWIEEDTEKFIAGRIERELEEYLEGILPPFFKELVRYAEEYRYAWHTPGHMGGFAFLRSPAGIACHKFFGENLFRADLSVSVPELGSLLDHEGVVRKAEKESAKVFGADETFYVLNGTSTANQIVWHARVAKGDIGLVDRNCHKSLNYAIMVTGGIPIYLKPTRNPYGTIGPIHVRDFSFESVEMKIRECPLIEDKCQKVKMAVITNSTYDGLCYNVAKIKKKLGRQVGNLHFDEAWFGYAKFHPIYAGHFGMSHDGFGGDHPPIFATQSTHKVLAALSQASMIHVKNGTQEKICHDKFNEAYMMHGSTSPQYSMIATLDVSTRMMKGVGGRRLMDETLEEAIVFRKKMAQIAKELDRTVEEPARKWWFTAWQPEEVTVGDKTIPFQDVCTKYLMENQDCWTLKPGQNWHLFPDIEENYIMLDPQKVTIATPGISLDGQLQDWGIPAQIVTKYLMTKGVVVEKTGHYSWLCLFCMGTSKGKSGTLIAEMLNFKKVYDNNALLEDVLPELVREYPGDYSGLTIQDLCQKMHSYIKDHEIVETMLRSFEVFPEQVMTPADAYTQLVRGNFKSLCLDDMMDRVPAVMVVPYPPGIPVIMPGEKFTRNSRAILDYLGKVEEFEYQFPGFESDIHGVSREESCGSKKRFKIFCLERETDGCKENEEDA